MKNWNLRLGRVAGIPIEIHWTFWLLLLFVFIGGINEDGTTRTALISVASVMSIFACVVLHELGHAMTAKYFGVKTRDITLYPIGGVARLERIPERPIQELLVAIAGPMVNVLIFMALWSTGARWPENMEDPSALIKPDFFSRLLMVNAVLVVFNLLPAFPMDGGRIFRAFLALFMDYARATRIAASLGQFMAILFGFIGLNGNPMLLFIALFVWLGASSEAASVEQRILLKSAVLKDAMLVDYETVRAEDTLDSVVKRLLKGSQSEFPVYDGSLNKPVGLLTRNTLLSSLAVKGPEAKVEECLLEALEQAQSDRPLVDVAQEMRENMRQALEVTDASGRVIGLLTLENLSEFILVQSALRSAT